MALKTHVIATPRNWRSLETHPLANLTEFGAGIDMDALAAFMKENGYDQSEPITLFENKILDGRHRHAGAMKAGVIPTFRVFEGRNAFEYVYKKAMRQHLNTSQRALLAATMVKHRAGDRTINGTPTAKEAAQALNVSEHSVDNAAAVITHGTTELQESVRDGTVTVTDAAVIAKEEPKVQKQAVDKVKKGKARTATAAAGKKPKYKPTRKEEDEKNGTPAYSEYVFNDHIGRAAAELDKLARLAGTRTVKNGQAAGAKRCKEHTEIIAMLEKAIALAKKWHAEVKKATKAK